MDFNNINFLAVVLSALAAFFLGFIWYTIVFAKPWQQEIGMDESMAAEAPSLGKMLLGSFVFELIMASTMAMIIGQGAGLVTGLKIGMMVGAGCVALAFGVNYMFEGKSRKLWLINAAYNVAVFAAMGAIIGSM